MIITINNLEDIFKCKKANHDILLLKGYELVEELFCDSSGFGLDNEPALTKEQLIKKVTRLLQEHTSLHAFITSMGYFQVYLGLYKKTGKSKVKKIALNTYRIETKTGYKIQYYDTVIVERDNGKVVLNNGGFFTRTTKDRIQKEIYPFIIYQKNWDWFIDTGKHKAIPFKEGLVLDCMG